MSTNALSGTLATLAGAGTLKTFQLAPIDSKTLKASLDTAKDPVG